MQLLFFLLSLIPFILAADTTPEGVSFRLSNTVFESQYVNTFLNPSGKWNYGAALLNLGFYEVMQKFTNNATETALINNTAVQYINSYYSSGKEAYNITHNITMPFDSSVGDHLGLYPVSYLVKYIYENKKVANDFFVANQAGVEYIVPFPIRLPDGTISRNSGWTGETGHNSFLWCDDTFMGLTLLNRLAIYSKWDEYIDFTASQFLGFAQHLQDTDGVFFHGYNNDDNHVSCCKWGRANGWVMMSLTETLLTFESFPGHPLQPSILSVYLKHVSGVQKLQDAGGLWRQVLNETSIWLETSCSAMFTYSMATGIVKGWLKDSDYGAAVDKAWKALATQVLDDGTVQGICEGCGIQSDLQGYADKSTAYSSSGPGLGSVLRAAVAYQNLLDWRQKLQ